MLFLTAYDSLAAWQKDDEEQSSNQWLATEQDKLRIDDSAYLSGGSHEFAELVPELSVPGKFPLGAGRCFSVTRIEVDPSQQREFRDWLHSQVKAKAAVLPHLGTYRVIAGGSVSTLILIEARVSRAEFDSNRLDWGTVAPGVKSISRDLFQPEPTMSRVNTEFAKGNEKFWFPPEP